MQDLVEGLRDHYWIQYKKGEDWVDLDPSFPGSAPGEAHAPVAETLDALPQQLFHQVVLRVMLEELKDGKLQQKALLTYQSPAPWISGQSLLLVHEPGSWSKPTAESDLGKAFGGVAKALTNFLGALGGGGSGSEAREDKARPVLVLGNQYVAGDAFDLTHPENAADQATAEWIEVAFHAPDGSVTTAERTIFDRIGYAARRQGKPRSRPGRSASRIRSPAYIACRSPPDRCWLRDWYQTITTHRRALPFPATRSTRSCRSEAFSEASTRRSGCSGIA
jgi:hypothetical protein